MKNQKTYISSVQKDAFFVLGQHGEIQAELTGKLAFETINTLDFPVVGDQVEVTYFNQNTLAIIQKILPRKNLLKRKSSGKTIAYQAIAANLDIGFIMQALDHNFNLNRLERYLVMLRECQIKPVVLLSKSDLCSSSAIQTALNLINNQHPNLSVFTFSNQTQTGLAQIKELFNKHHLYCLLGSSGVGKTTLVNHLIGQDQFKTQAVRHQDQRGKHTTSARQLIQLSNQAYLIDTPGMRELGHIELDTGLKNTFADIIEIASQCKFANCTHTSEQGCAIQKALTKKELSPKHFENYQKLQKESAYHSMSYYEKRSKDKEFGKMVKRVLKNKPHKHS